MLGEEATGGGTARYVDSSVERLQVTRPGHRPAPAPRHLPGRAGAADARPANPASSTPACATAPGSRGRRCTRRSRCTPRCTFDVVDTDVRPSASAARRTTSSTPAAAPTTHPPVNANEAEARRASRFEARGHTAGRLDVAALRRRRAARRDGRVPAHPRPAPRAAGVLMTDLDDGVRDRAARLRGGRHPAGAGRRPDPRYDEVVAPDGSLRAGMEGDGRRSPAGSPTTTCAGAMDDINRFLADDGVTYAKPGAGQRTLEARPRPAACSTPRSGPASRSASPNGSSCSTRSSSTFTASSACVAEGRVPAAVVFGHAGFTRVVARASARRPAASRARRHRPRTRRGWRVAGARRPRAGAVGAGLRDGEPAGHLPGAARALPRGRAAPDGAVLRGPAVGADAARRRASRPTPGSWCSRRARTPRPPTTRPSWPRRWASRSCRAATCWCATAGSGCARRAPAGPTGWSGSM